MTTDEPQKDLVIEARELFASYGRGNRSIDMTTKAFLLLRQLCDEVERLKRGDFTAEELQNLCHNLDTDDRRAFFDGCTKYQERLFGTSAVAEARKESK